MCVITQTSRNTYLTLLDNPPIPLICVFNSLNIIKSIKISVELFRHFSLHVRNVHIQAVENKKTLFTFLTVLARVLYHPLYLCDHQH